MPHIDIASDEPGIRGLMAARPDTAAPLNHLAETLLRSPLSLLRGQRELMAAYTSHLNATPYRSGSHAAFAAAQLEGGREVVDAVLADLDTAPVSPRLRALLRIAAEVRGPPAGSWVLRGGCEADLGHQNLYRGDVRRRGVRRVQPHRGGLDAVNDAVAYAAGHGGPFDRTVSPRSSADQGR
ncbi:hypothetical protein ACWGLP_09880 [Streptomyces lydicus]